MPIKKELTYVVIRPKHIHTYTYTHTHTHTHA